MPVVISLEQVMLLAPSARSSYREAFASGQAVLDRFDISATPLRVAHFMAQILHESAGLTFQFENLMYSAPGLVKTWPSRFLPKGPLDPMALAHLPEKLANEVYGGRMGNSAPGDGFKYRGRGLLQLTGKSSYAEATTLVRQRFPDAPDFTAEPDRVIGADWCLQVAAAEWVSKGCNALADKNAITAITRAINSGLIGLSQRQDWLRKTSHVWH